MAEGMVTSNDWTLRSAAAASLLLLLAAPAVARACDMNAVDQELAREPAATPQTWAADRRSEQRPIVLASPSPDNDEAAQSSSSSQGQSSGSAQGSGSSQTTQQKQ